MAKKKSETNSSSFGLWALHIGASILFGVLFLFLATNILFAVSLPDLDTVMSGKKEDVVHFMKRARTLTPFRKLFPEIKSTFVENELEVYKDDRDRRTLILKLEEALKVNPKSRDVLYSLYLLYDKSGDAEKAALYLQQAQEVDPTIDR